MFAVVLRDGTFAIFAKKATSPESAPLNRDHLLRREDLPDRRKASRLHVQRVHAGSGYVFPNGQGRVSGTDDGHGHAGCFDREARITRRHGHGHLPQPAPSLTRAALPPPLTIAGYLSTAVTSAHELVIDATTTINADGNRHRVRHRVVFWKPGMSGFRILLATPTRVTNNAQCPGIGMPASAGVVFFPAGTGGAINGGEFLHGHDCCGSRQRDLAGSW